MRISLTVERVVTTLPQAQVIVALSYFGCMSFFMIFSSKTGGKVQGYGFQCKCLFFWGYLAARAPRTGRGKSLAEYAEDAENIEQPPSPKGYGGQARAQRGERKEPPMGSDGNRWCVAYFWVQKFTTQLLLAELGLSGADSAISAGSEAGTSSQ